MADLSERVRASLAHRYAIERELGRGGMATVYLARDLKHDRPVALKVLRPELAAILGVERFLREIRLTAQLQHPHILTLIDSGEADGFLYYVMPFVESKSLRERLEREGQLPLDEALRITRAVASALDFAHTRGVIHRDIKPENIMLLQGQPMVADFGIALAVSAAGRERLTETGLSLGTPAYMSPEQATGEREVDNRSDQYSLACVVYEMLAGTPPYTGPTAQAVIARRLTDPVPPLRTVREYLPVAVEEAVKKALAKVPADRFASAAAFAEALTKPTTVRELASARATDAQPSIAVLPFVNMSADPGNEYFSDGLAEEISNALTHIPALKVIARTSAFAFKGKHEDVRRIAEMLGVAHVLEGSVRKAGNRIRVTAQLIAAADGTHLWSERYDRELADVFAIQDEIAQAIALALQMKVASKPPPGVPPPNLAAYEALLKGRHHMARFETGSLARAKDWFDQAMALDPYYAEPHASLGLSYFLAVMIGVRSLKQTMPLIRTEAETALRLDPTNPSPHSLLGAVAAAYDYDWTRAAEHFATAMAGTSVSVETHWAYASLYLQPLGRFQEAVSQMQRAVDRDPLNAFWRGVLASHLTHARQYERAIQQANEALEIDPTNWVPLHTLGEAYATSGQWVEAITALERAHQLAPLDALASGTLAGALARIGDRKRAEALIRDMGEAPRPIFGRVMYHLLCSESDQAADWYERAVEQRDPFALVFANGPLSAAFRQSSRWPKLASMMHLPDATSE